MNKLQKITDYYNDRQDEWKIKEDWVDKFANKKGLFIKTENKYFLGAEYNTIGFYEWLFNPRYKVFEVFDVKVDSIINVYEVKRTIATVDKVEEIIDYMYKEIQ